MLRQKKIARVNEHEHAWPVQEWGIGRTRAPTGMVAAGCVT